MHGVTNCVSARRDHVDALFFSSQPGHCGSDTQPESRIRNWMRSSHSPEDPSAGGAFDVKADQQRQTQLLAPELRPSVSPRKASFKPSGSSRDNDWLAAGDARMVGGTKSGGRNVAGLIIITTLSHGCPWLQISSKAYYLMTASTANGADMSTTS